MFWLRNKKNNFSLCTLIWGTALRCIFGLGWVGWSEKSVLLFLSLLCNGEIVFSVEIGIIIFPEVKK